MNPMYYLTLIGVVLAGGIIAKSTTLIKKESINDFLTFSAAFLFGIVAVHLIPLIGRTQHPYIGVCILLGFLIQILIETLTEGVEHGHQHHGMKHKFWPLVLGLTLHAFLEGLPLEFYHDLETHTQDHTSINALYWGIVIHKFPAAFTLGVLMKGMSLRGLRFYGPLLIFAFATPLGAALPHFLPLDQDFQIITISVVVGFMLHIATTILYEIDKEHHSGGIKKISLLILGMGLAALSAH